MNEEPHATCRNLLEPSAFAGLFASYPPAGFVLPAKGVGSPGFCTDFDLLTTLEQNARARLSRLPLFTLWSKLLRFSTYFVGTTITEYAPLPKRAAPAALLDAVLSGEAQEHALTIMKDLPDHSPLLPEEDNVFAAELAALATDRGFITVEGQALAYVPITFGSVGEYLERLSAGRRKDLRRKMKKRPLLEVESLPLGHARFADPAFVDELYGMYLAVFEQSDIHFDLLTPEFFTALLRWEGMGGVVFFYRHEGRLAGYNLCLIHNGLLIDKYIGFTYPLARDLNLYFISWMVNLEFALQNNLHTYIAGWTDPEVKASLGASFTFTRHLVWVRSPMLRRILRPLRPWFESDGRAIRGVK